MAVTPITVKRVCGAMLLIGDGKGRPVRDARPPRTVMGDRSHVAGFNPDDVLEHPDNLCLVEGEDGLFGESVE